MNKQKLPINYSIDEDFRSDKFLKLRMRICHDGVNPNGSKFSIEDLEAKKDTLANSPILANVYFDEDDVPQFGGHDISIEEDKTNPGEAKIIYVERPVGVIPESNNFEVVNENGINYIYADGYIWKNYSNYCPDIIERYGELKISMEVEILAYKYDVSDDIYDITNFNYLAVTLLNEDMETGMKNARANVEDFSKSGLNNDKYMSFILQELGNELADNYEKNTKGEIGEMNSELISSILDEYELTLDDLNFEITEDMSEETFRSKLDEFKKDNSKANNDDGDDDNDDANDDDDDFACGGSGSKSGCKKKKKYSDSKISSKSFITANQKRDALRKALPDVCERDEDGRCIKSVDYYIRDFDDVYVYVDRYVYTPDSGSYDDVGRFAYTMSDSGDITITGEFTKMVASWLTVEEAQAIADMRSEYSDLKSQVKELNDYKLKAENEKKEAAIAEIFEDFDNELADVEEYSNLKDNYADMTVENITAKCYMLLGQKSKKATKSTKDDKTVKFNINHDTQDEHKDEPWYQELFDKYSK